MYLSSTLALAAVLALAPLVAGAETNPGDSGRGSNGTVETFTLPACSTAIRLGKNHRWSMTPDSCLSVSTSSSFRILEPALCPNGTRARLGRYEGRGCNGGEVTAPDGLVDLADGDVSGAGSDGRCFEIMPESLRGKGAGYASFSFYCDGRTTSGGGGDDGGDGEGDGSGGGEKTGGGKTRKGSVSHNICPVRGDSRPRAPTFRHPDPDTCQNLPAGQPLKVLGVAVCRDGSDAQLARWRGAGCSGAEPATVAPVLDSELDSCLWGEKEGGDTSYAFWCSGEIVRGGGGDGRGGGSGHPIRTSGSILGLILVLFLIGAFGILIFAFALLRWAAVVNRIMALLRRDGVIAL